MVLLLLVIGLSLITAQVSSQTQPSCDSKVYCQGPLLHTVQLARLFNDSKTFVDLKLVNNEEITLKNFDEFMQSVNQTPSKDEVQKFVDENFEDYNEFEEWVPTDFKSNPEFLSKITDADLKQFAEDLVNIWPTLARKIKQEVLDNPELFTLLPVEQGFVIPGGRFKEFYYWDSYWIIKGLLLSEMYETVRGMLENFLSLVESYGFVPNGSRKYYLNRSQPPLLNLMVMEYIKATGNDTWLKNHVGTLDKELRYWLDNQVVTVIKDGIEYDLAHYDVESGSPRPESYYEDFVTASALQQDEDKIQLYADLKSGAESGWDFSSRWIIDDKGGNNATLTYLKTRRIIPVDLNAFLCQAFQTLAAFYLRLFQFDEARFWLNKSLEWSANIQKVLYNEEDGIWYDWDNELQQPRKYFFPSNFAPLWSMSYDQRLAETLGERAAEYLVSQGILNYEGGIPTSTSQSGEQWDYPNAWPPLQAIVILGLDRTGNCDAKNVSRILAERWINANHLGYQQTNEMFEKYDARNPGQYGGGGEYVVQTGFGWTNGFALELIDHFYTKSLKKRF